MSKKFHAVSRETGERWKPDKSHYKQYLVMYDSGYLAVVTQDFYTHIEPLDTKIWKLVKNRKVPKNDEGKNYREKESTIND